MSNFGLDDVKDWISDELVSSLVGYLEEIGLGGVVDDVNAAVDGLREVIDFLQSPWINWLLPANVKRGLVDLERLVRFLDSVLEF